MKIDSLISNPSNVCDTVTNFCIELLSHMSRELGMTYGELNIYMFVVFYPLLLLCFILASVITNKKIKITLLSVGFGSIFIFMVMLILFTIDILVLVRGSV